MFRVLENTRFKQKGVLVVYRPTWLQLRACNLIGNLQSSRNVDCMSGIEGDSFVSENSNSPSLLHRSVLGRWY